MAERMDDEAVRRTSTLTCANCGCEYLHHTRVSIYERQEDAFDGLHIEVGDNQVVMNTSQEGNPSPRRSGIKIRLDCEGCNKITWLSLIQHKGQTIMIKTDNEEGEAHG